MAASDSEFIWYIKTKKDAYDDGGDLTADAFVTLPLNKYEMLNKQDAWNAKSIEQEQSSHYWLKFRRLRTQISS
jgi:hypothetical protein